MPLDVVLGIALIVAPFVLFAAALAYGDYQCQHRND